MTAVLRAAAALALLAAAACAPTPPAGDATVPLGPDAIEGDV